MTDGTITLSLAAVDLLWERLGLDTKPVIFEIPGVGMTLDDRARIREEVFAELARRGLMRRGEVAPDLAAMLTLVGRAPVAVEAVGVLAGGRRLCARAVSDGRLAVLAVLADEALRLDRVRPTGLVPAMLELIGRARPGPGRSVSYPGAERPEVRSGELLRRAYPAPTGFDGQRQQAQAFLAKPRTQLGLFIVVARDRNFREITQPALLWFDTAAGRYLGHARTGADGQTWTTYAPADNARLADQLTALLTQNP